MYDDDVSFIAEQQLAEAIESHIEASADVIDEISKLEEKIQTWNMEESKELRSWIVTMRRLLAKHFQISIENFTNMKKIPTQKIPEVLAPIYGIVAIDKKGISLYGKEMDKLAHIDKIKQHYERNKQAK
jgi:hypothetical protein